MMESYARATLSLQGLYFYVMTYFYRKWNRVPYLDYHNNTTPYNQSWGDYSTDIMTNRAVEVIEETFAARNTNGFSATGTTSPDPFFMFLSYQAPHNPLQVTIYTSQQFVDESFISHYSLRYFIILLWIGNFIG